MVGSLVVQWGKEKVVQRVVKSAGQKVGPKDGKLVALTEHWSDTKKVDVKVDLLVEKRGDQWV